MKLIFTLLLVCTFFVGSAQTNLHELVSSSGGSFSGNNVLMDWSLGEIVTETVSTDNNVLTQGFHQDVYEISEIFRVPNELFEVSVFPNPTSNTVFIKISEKNNSADNYTISDFSGRCIAAGVLNSDMQSIDFSTFTKGIYILNIYREGIKVHSFKIIKK